MYSDDTRPDLFYTCPTSIVLSEEFSLVLNHQLMLLLFICLEMKSSNGFQLKSSAVVSF